MKKKLENIWYYYKYYILAGLLAVVMIAVSINSCVNKEDHDITLLYMTHSYVDIDGEMEPLVGKYTKDHNGDGKVNARVIPISYGTTHAESQSAGSTRAAQLATGEFVLFLVDEQNYTELRDNGFLMDISHLGKSSKLDGDRFDATELLYNIDGFKATDQKFYFCIRVFDEAKAKQHKDYNERYEIAYDYIKTLCEEYK